MVTKIEGKYWDKSFNPIEEKGGGWHCTKCSPGCLHCWAELQNLRFGNKLPYDNRKVEYVLNEKILQQPLRRKTPTTYFVCDLCDLFHEAVPFEDIEEVYWTMLKAKQHRFLILTKRVKRFLEFSQSGARVRFMYFNEPPKNILSGVSISTQAEADEIIPIHLQIPAAVRFVSFEPLLGEIDLKWNLVYPSQRCSSHIRNETPPKGIGWVIIGCESINGRAGRFQDGFVEAAINLVRQCKTAGVPVFVKQIPIAGKVSKNMAEWPEELQVQEMPNA